MMKRYGCAIAVALLAVGAGCGGDEEEALSKAEYIKQGDMICKEASAELEKQANEAFPGDEEPSGEEITSFVEDTLKPNIEGQLNDLRDLTPPEADEETVNGIYDGVEEAMAEVQDDPMLLLAQGEDPFEGPSREAGDYGFKECSE